MKTSSRIVRPTPQIFEKSRRDFLAWLAAGTALSAVGCAAESGDDRLLGAKLDPNEPADEGDADAEDAATLEDEQTACRVTTRDAKGPYWEPGSPLRTTSLITPDEAGVRLLLEGRMFGPDCRTPLKNYTLDLWQADATGAYHSGADEAFRMRGKIKTDATGRYSVQTILPGRYGDAAGIRPAHIHVSFLSPGGNVILTTQLYFKGDPYLGQADYCTRQGTCNSADAKRALNLQSAWIGDRVGKRASFNPVLPRT